jgi:hypothetical protein
VVIVIQNVDGNVMIQSAQLSAILSVRDQNAKFIVKRLNVPSARFIVISHNVTFVALRISVRRRIALNARLSAPQLTAVLNVRLLMLSAPQCVKQPNVTGNVRSQLLALNQNVNLSVKDQLVILVPVRLVPRVDAVIALTKLTWLLLSVLLTP